MTTALVAALKNAARLHLASPEAARDVAQQVRNELHVIVLGLAELLPSTWHPEKTSIEHDINEALTHIEELTNKLHNGAA